MYWLKTLLTNVIVQVMGKCSVSEQSLPARYQWLWQPLTVPLPKVAEQSLNVPSPLSGKVQPGLSQPLPNIHSNMLWNRSVPPPHENDGGSAPCVSAVMTASVSKPLFEPDGRALCFRDHRYFAPCVVASRW